MAFLEAQASGLPVVAGPSGGVPDIVENGATGFLCPEGDARAFAAALDRFLSDPAVVSDFGRSAVQHAERHLDTAIACRKLQEILRKAQAIHAARQTGTTS